MTAHLQPFYCSLCRTHLGNIMCATVEDIKEIYNLCYAKKSGMVCKDCTSKLKEADKEIDR